MRTKGVTDERTLRRDGRGRMRATAGAPRALTVLAVEPWKGPNAADQIKALCEGLPGIRALWVDADRGRIHVLHDGTVEAVEQVEKAVRIPGHRIRLVGDRSLLPPHAQTGTGAV